MKRIIILLLTAFVILLFSCDTNVYIDEEKIWRVGNEYFETANEAIEYVMKHSSSRSLTKTDDEARTVVLTRPVLAEGSDGITDEESENYIVVNRLRGNITIPSGFEGNITIDFGGFRYDFSSNLDAFFVIDGGDNVYIYNGTSVIFEDADIEPYAISVNTDTVTIDEHLIDDRRAKEKLLSVSENGHLRIDNSEGFEGEIELITDGRNGGVLEIENSTVTFTDIYTKYKNADGSVEDTIALDIADEAKSRIEILSGDVTILGINKASDYYNSETKKVFDKAYLNTLGTEENTTVKSAHSIHEAVDKAIGNSEGTAENVIKHNMVDHPRVEETCTTDGTVEYWTCNGSEDCKGRYYTKEDGSEWVTDKSKLVIPCHTVSTEWSYDIDYHWHECTADGKHIDEEAHTWSDWKERSSGNVTHLYRECNVCGARKVATKPEYLVYNIGIGEIKLKELEATPVGDFYVNGVLVESGKTINVSSPDVTVAYKPYYQSNVDYTPFSYFDSKTEAGIKDSGGGYSVTVKLPNKLTHTLNIQLITEGGSLNFVCYLKNK